MNMMQYQYARNKTGSITGKIDEVKKGKRLAH